MRLLSSRNGSCLKCFPLMKTRSSISHQRQWVLEINNGNLGAQSGSNIENIACSPLHFWDWFKSQLDIVKHWCKTDIARGPRSFTFVHPITAKHEVNQCHLTTRRQYAAWPFGTSAQTKALATCATFQPNPAATFLLLLKYRRIQMPIWSSHHKAK